jgi:DNA-binding protein WhiA
MREIRRENQQLSSGEKLQVFEDANAIRSATAGLAQSAQLKWASERIDLNSLEETAREIVERRIKHPQFSLTELAMSFEDPAVTKDVVAGVIRRTINRATRESGQEPPTTN